MTIKEFILAKLSFWGSTYPENLIDAAFLAAKVDPAQPYDDKAEKTVFKVFYQLIPDIMVSVPKSMSEGGYSVSYNTEAMTAFYSMICAKLGLPDLITNTPKVTDISRKW